MNAPRRLRTALAALVTLLCASTALAQSSVWKVTRNGKTLYLGGTVHLLRLSDFPLPPEFGAAFQASDKIYFETDFSRIQSPDVQMSFAVRGRFNDGKDLAGVLSPAAWEAAKTHSARVGLPLESVSRMKPWLFAMTVTLLELQKIGVVSEGVDVHFYKKSLETNKPASFLETIEEQIGFITTMGAGHESDMVLHTIEDLAEITHVIKGIIAAWRAGDLGSLDRLFLANMRKKYPAIYKSLLVDRNTNWIPKLDDLLKSRETEFVLVGAGHLPGPDGIMNHLRNRGCKIEQLKAK